MIKISVVSPWQCIRRHIYSTDALYFSIYFHVILNTTRLLHYNDTIMGAMAPHHCLLNRLFWRRSKTTSMLRVIGLCAGNSPVTDEFPAHMASNTGKVSIWWPHDLYCRRAWLILTVKLTFLDTSSAILSDVIWWSEVCQHDDVIKWKHFLRYWPYVQGIHRWIPRIKASDAEIWHVLLSLPE